MLCWFQVYSKVSQLNCFKTWDLSSLPGMKPVSPALEGRFLTTGSPGKSPRATFHTLENTVFVRLPAIVSHMLKCHTLFLRLT